mmetsp:Transcript_38971/g.115917  ORF Transcript_38971/g.115917 Transcript_38971/m.115917 type:complete len:623 (-) Transcript_38971:541-2409(-)
MTEYVSTPPPAMPKLHYNPTLITLFVSCMGSRRVNQFCDACREGELQRARAMLRRHPSLVSEGYLGIFDNSCPWNDAAATGDTELLREMHDLLVGEDSPLAAKMSATRRTCRLYEQLDGYSGRDLDSPLSHAAAAGHIGAVAQLIRMGADPTAPDYSGRSVVHMAARDGKLDVLRAIFDAVRDLPPDVKARHRRKLDHGSNMKLSALHYAMSRNEPDARTVKVLLDGGCNPLSRTAAATTVLGFVLPAGSTALHAAAILQNKEAALALLRHQAMARARGAGGPRDLRAIRNGKGQTPYHIARDMHAPVDLVELLHTSTDMMAMFTQDLLMQDRGVPKLSFIAAAALKSKLNEDIRFVRRSSPAGAAGAGGSRSAGGAGSPSKPPSSGPVYARRGRLDSAPQVERMSRGGSVASVDDDAASIHDVRVGPQASPSGGSGIGSRGTPYVRTRFASTGAGGVPLDDSGEDAGGDAAAVEAEVVELVGGGNDGGPGGEEADPLLGSGAPCFHTKHNAHEPPSSLGAGSDVGTSDSGRCSSGDGGASPSAAVASALTACDSVDEETACMLCFEGRADVQIGGCHHKMCANCANELTARVMCQPLSCPFCRASITAFVPAPKEEGAGVV